MASSPPRQLAWFCPRPSPRFWERQGIRSCWVLARRRPPPPLVSFSVVDGKPLIGWSNYTKLSAESVYLLTDFSLEFLLSDVLCAHISHWFTVDRRMRQEGVMMNAYVSSVNPCNSTVRDTCLSVSSYFFSPVESSDDLSWHPYPLRAVPKSIATTSL